MTLLPDHLSNKPSSSSEFWLEWPSDLNDSRILIGINNRELAEKIVDAVYSKTYSEDYNKILSFGGDAKKYTNDLQLIEAVLDS